jgi:hypothetical protein
MNSYRIQLGFEPADFMRQQSVINKMLTPRVTRKDPLIARRKWRERNQAKGLRADGKPRKRPPCKWPLLDKQNHAAYVRLWRAEKKKAFAPQIAH